MQITNGKVSFTRSVKPADYEKKEATVELSFGIADGEDPAEVVARVGQLAQEKALQLVGLKPVAVAPPLVSAQAGAPPATGGKEAYAAANAPARRPPGRPPKPAAEPPKAGPAAVTGNDADPAASAEAMKATHAAAEVSDDDALLGTESRPPITDEVIRKALTLKNKKLQDAQPDASKKQGEAVKLRGLIQKYAKSSAEIPADVRQKFLDELEALT